MTAYAECRSELDRRGYSELLPPAALPLVCHLLRDLSALQLLVAPHLGCREEEQRPRAPEQQERPGEQQQREQQREQHVRRLNCAETRLMDSGAGDLPGVSELYTDDAKAANGMTATAPRVTKPCLQCGCHGGAGGRSGDDRLQQLQELVQRQQQEVTHAHDTCTALKRQLSHRDSELQRLRNLVGGGSATLAAAVRDSCAAAARDQLQHLQREHDALQQEHAVLQQERAALQDQHHLVKKQLQQLQSKYDEINVHYMELKKKFNSSLHSNHEAMQRAVVLSEQLQEAAYANVQLEVDRNQASTALSHTVKCAQGKLEWAESDLDKQQRLYHLMKQERDSLLAEVVQVRHENSRLSHQHIRLQEQHGPLLERCSTLHKDKKQLVDKINHLTVQVEEKAGVVARLQGELEVAQASLERLQRENRELISDKEVLTQQVSDLSRRLDETQQERQYYKGEASTLQEHRDNLIQQLEDLTEAKGVVEQRLEDVESQRSSGVDALRQTRDSLQGLQKRHRQTEAKLAKVRAERQTVQAECEQYKEQVQELLLMLQGGRSSGQSSPPDNGASVDEKMGRIRQERDLMKHELRFLKSKLKAAQWEKDQATKSLAEARSDAEDSVDVSGASARPSARGKDGRAAAPRGPAEPSARDVDGVMRGDGKFGAASPEFASDEADFEGSDADYPATSAAGHPAAAAADRRAGADSPFTPPSSKAPAGRGLQGILRTSRGSRSLVSSNGSPASGFSETRSDAAFGDVAGVFEVSGVVDTASAAAGGVAVSLDDDDASRKLYPTSTGLPFTSTHPPLADLTASVGATAARPSPASVPRTFGVSSASRAAATTGIAPSREFETSQYVTAGPTQVTAVVPSSAQGAAPTLDSVAGSVSPPYSPPSLASSGTPGGRAGRSVQVSEPSLAPGLAGAEAEAGGFPGPGAGLAGPGAGLAGPAAGLASPGAGLASPGAGRASPGAGRASPGAGLAGPSTRASKLAGLVAAAHTQDLRQTIRQLEAKLLSQGVELSTAKQEKDFFERQYSAMKKSGGVQPGVAAAAAAGGVSERELASVVQERDFYSAQLSSLTKQLADLPATSGPNAPTNTREEFEAAVAEKRAAVVEKVELEAKLRALAEEAQEQAGSRRDAEDRNKQLQAALQKLQDAAVQQLPPSSQSFISEIRKSRDAALAELDAIKKDRDTLRSKMKQVTTQQARDGAASSEAQRSLQQKVEQSKRIVTEQQQRLQTQANVLSGVQVQLQSLQDQLQNTNKQLRDSNAQNNILKSQLGSSAAELSEQLQELERRNRTLSASDNRVRDLTEQCDELSAEGDRLRRELLKLRNAHTELNDEHDRLMAELTSKKEIISAQAGQLQQRADTINSLQADVARLEAQIRAGAQALAEERAVLAAEKQRLSELRAQLEDTEGQRDAALKEIRRLQGEMASLQKDLDQCRTQRDLFKQRTQEYCATLEKLGEALAAKASEECALKQQYLSLNDTIELLKTHSQSLEGDVVIKDKKLGHMETLVEESKRERDQLLQQVAEAAEQVAEFDARCKALEEAKFQSDKELISSKELAQRLDSKRAELEGELNRTEDALEKLLQEKGRLQQAVERLEAALNGERAEHVKLEAVLAEKRRLEWSSESETKQIVVEKQQLSRRLAEIQTELESEAAECRRLRSQAALADAEVERLRRELTNEQYEKERANQELRRLRSLQLLTF